MPMEVGNFSNIYHGTCKTSTICRSRREQAQDVFSAMEVEQVIAGKAKNRKLYEFHNF